MTTFTTMQAARIRSSPTAPYSAQNPAPSEAIFLDDQVPAPRIKSPGQVLVRVHATTVTRDELMWPETYVSDLKILGHDVSGIVVAVHEDSPKFRVGDEVYGMINMHEGCSWAEYVVAWDYELALKPRSLTWAESVTVPMSGLTAWEALFDKAGVPEPDLDAIAAHGRHTPKSTGKPKSLLVTGASGMVGTWIVQLAALAGLVVTAATSSNGRNRDFLQSLGATEAAEYNELRGSGRSFDIVIDTAGGDAYELSWSLIADDGNIITVESSNFDVDKRARPLGKDTVKVLFFIVTTSGSVLEKLTRVMDLGLARPFVAETYPLAEARAAYERASGRLEKRGKVVLEIS